MTESESTTYYIVGSCVSRDAFSISDAPRLSGYTARTSLASAFAPKPLSIDSLDIEANPSAFQRRMILTDIDKLLPGILAASRFDRLILDLIDERFNLVRVDDTVFTYSPEIMRCIPRPDRQHLILSGSSEHRERFRNGIQSLIKHVDPSRIILNQVRWGSVDNTGSALPNAENISRNNDLLEEFYGAIYDLGVTTSLTYEEDDFVVDADHKWGVGPYHYTQRFYDATLRQLGDIERHHSKG